METGNHNKESSPKKLYLLVFRRIWRFLKWPICLCLGVVGLDVLLEIYFFVQSETVNPYCQVAMTRYVCEIAEVFDRDDCFSLPFPVSRYITTYHLHPEASVIRHYRDPKNASPEYRVCIEDQLRRRGSCIIPLPISEFLERVYARIKGKRFYELDEECPGWHERPLFA